MALLRDSRRNLSEVRGTATMSEVQEQARRGRAAVGVEGPARIDGSSVGPEDFGHVSRIARRRPQVRGMAIPQNVMEFVLERPVELDVALFTKCLHSAPSGSAFGPGCTNEMLRVCLDSSNAPARDATTSSGRCPHRNQQVRPTA